MRKLTAAERRFRKNATIIAALRLIFSKLEQAGVPSYRLGEIADTMSGGTPSRHHSEYYGGQIPWIKSGELSDGFIKQSHEHITEEGLRNSSAKVFPKGTLVVALYGATVGKTGILSIDAASNQAVCAVTPKSVDVSTRYLFWFLRHKRPDFISNSFGGAQPNISQKILRATCLPLPGIALQNQICQFVDAAEQRQMGEHDVPLPALPSPLSKVRRIVVRVEELAALIEEAQGLRVKARGEAARLVGDTVVDLFADREDDGWTEYHLADLVTEVRYGTSEKAHVEPLGTPILRMGNIQDGRLDLTDLKYLYLADRHRENLLLKAGDVLVNRTNSAELVGKCAVFEEEGEYTFASYLIRLRFDLVKAEPRLIAAYINSPIGRAYMFSKRKQMTGQANVNSKTLRAMPISLPQVEEQRRILAHLDDLQAQVDEFVALQAATQSELDALLPSVLDRAFRGEL